MEIINRRKRMMSIARKLRRVLKWQPKVDLREGLKRTVDFYRAHRAEYWATPEPAIA